MSQTHLCLTSCPDETVMRLCVHLIQKPTLYGIISICRSEPTCVTCDLSEVLWSSRYYYSNCTHFNAYVSPPPYAATNSGITHYILECKGPGLPLAGMVYNYDDSTQFINYKHTTCLYHLFHFKLLIP